MSTMKLVSKEKGRMSCFLNLSIMDTTGNQQEIKKASKMFHTELWSQPWLKYKMC